MIGTVVRKSTSYLMRQRVGVASGWVHRPFPTAVSQPVVVASGNSCAAFFAGSRWIDQIITSETSWVELPSNNAFTRCDW